MEENAGTQAVTFLCESKIDYVYKQSCFKQKEIWIVFLILIFNICTSNFFIPVKEYQLQ